MSLSRSRMSRSYYNNRDLQVAADVTTMKSSLVVVDDGIAKSMVMSQSRADRGSYNDANQLRYKVKEINSVFFSRER